MGLKKTTCVLALLFTLFTTVVALEPIGIKPVGPGQEVILQFNRGTREDEYVQFDLIDMQEGENWETNLTKDSNFLYYHMNVPKDTETGSYTFQLLLKDRETLTEPAETVVQIYVTKNPDELIAVDSLAEEKEIYAEKKSNIEIGLTNKAEAQAQYKLTLSIPSFPSFKTKEVVHTIPAKSMKRTRVNFTLPERGFYNAKIKVTTEANPAINKEIEKTVIAKPSIESKLKNIGRGFPLVPSTLAPFYAVLGLFGT